MLSFPIVNHKFIFVQGVERTIEEIISALSLPYRKSEGPNLCLAILNKPYNTPFIPPNIRPKTLK